MAPPGPIPVAAASAAWPSWSRVAEVVTFRGGFNTNVVLIGATLLGFAAGIVGVFAMLRKRALLSDALSHATLPGIAAIFIGATALGADARTLPLLLAGAAGTGVLGVLGIQWLLRHTRLREDAAIGIVLSVFFGAGVVLLSVIQTMEGAQAAGLNKFIYGQAAAMRVPDVVVMGVLALGAVAAALAFFKEFTLVCFNDEFAKSDGWPVTAIDLVMMALVVAVTVAGLQAVGLILVVAMLIIPPVAARFWTDRLAGVVAVAGVLGGTSGFLGAALSSLLPRMPAGSVIVLTSGVVFTVSLLIAPTRGVLASTYRQASLRVRIAREHVLERAFDHQMATGGAALPAEEVRSLAARRGWSWWFRGLVVLSLLWGGRSRRDPVGGVALTDLGRRDGARIARNHHLWEQYLISHADVAPSHVDWSADQVEHVLSEPLVRELEEALRERGVRAPAGADARGDRR